MKKLSAQVLILFVFFTTHMLWAQKPTVAFVLSGGGARGFAHVGVLKVLEEVGFKPDLITGTSMGSVIGGLYSIGYNSDTLTKIVAQTNWDQKIYDKEVRQDLNAIERERFDRYVVKLNFEGIKFVSSSGFLKGTSVHNMLTWYCLPASEISDFNKLPVPFACIATDIQTGEKVVLNRGSLPNSIRASMAIPTLFTSIEIDGKILVDGGLTQNYPIAEAKAMGADYIIGVDVGTKSTKEELASFVNVMMESMFLHGYQNYPADKQFLNINIKPLLNGISPLDFAKGDSIIKLGEYSARLQIEQLKELYKQIYGQEDKSVLHKTSLKNRTYKVKAITYNGLKYTNPITLKSITDNYIGRELTSAQIQNMLSLLEATNQFERILYEYKNDSNEGKIILNVEEKARGEFDIGINYNNYKEASVLLGLQYRRVIFKNGTVKADVRLSTTPRFDLSYIYKSRYKPSISLDFSINNFRQGLYDSNNYKFTTVYPTLASLYVRLKYHINNASHFGVGFGAEYFSYETDAIWVGGELKPINSSQAANVASFYYKKDNLNDGYMPTKGSKVGFNYSLVNNNFDLNKTWSTALLRYEHHDEIGKRWVLSKYVNVGYNDDHYVSGNEQYMFALGGMLETRYRYVLPFAGLYFSQQLAQNVGHVRVQPKFKLFTSNYISLVADAAQTSNQLNQFFTQNNLMFAGGLSYDYKSPIGPIQFNVSKSTLNKDFLFYINLGYWF